MNDERPLGGAMPTFTDDQILAALKRVYALCSECTQTAYSALRLENEPSERTIRCRFGTFNKAKIKAGLPITVKVRKATSNLKRGLVSDRVTTYPCWKCKRPFKGRGRRKGNWHCESCTESINAHAASMGWMAC